MRSNSDQTVMVCTRCNQVSSENAPLCNYCLKKGSYFFCAGFILSLMYCFLCKMETNKELIELM